MVVVWDWEAVTKVLSPLIVALLSVWLKQWLEGRTRLLVHVSTSGSALVKAGEPGPTPPGTEIGAQPAQQAPIVVHTHTIVIRNAGNKVAKNVRIDHVVLPGVRHAGGYSLWPSIHHTVTSGEGGTAEILIPVLAPKEKVSITYIYLPPLTWAQIGGWVKSDEGLARVTDVVPEEPVPAALRAARTGMMLVGASTLLYWLLGWIRPLLN